MFKSSDLSAILLYYINTVWGEIKGTVFDIWWIKFTFKCSLAGLVKPTNTGTDTWNKIKYKVSQGIETMDERKSFSCEMRVILKLSWLN